MVYCPNGKLRSGLTEQLSEKNMPMGLVSDEDFEIELRAKHKEMERGRGNGTKGVPPIIREIASADALAGVPAKEIAADLGISESSIAAYKHDATSTSTYHEPNTELKRANDTVRDNITHIARTRLLDALNHITPERLAEAKLREVSAVARDMSAIVKDQVGPSDSNSNGSVQFIFHVPKQKRESEFEVIDVTS